MLNPPYQNKMLLPIEKRKHDKHCVPFPPIKKSPFEKFKEKFEEIKKKLDN